MLNIFSCVYWLSVCLLWKRVCFCFFLFLVTPCSFIHSFISVAQSCPTLCDPINRSTPGLPVNHQLPEFTQTHVHRVSDAIQPSHPLSSLSPPALNPSQHQNLFQWVKSAWSGQSTGVSALASFLPKKSQADLHNGLVGSPCSPRDSQDSSPTPQFKSINSSVLNFLHSPTQIGRAHVWTPVTPKGNQSWIFIGRTGAKAENPVLWPPDVKN